MSFRASFVSVVQSLCSFFSFASLRVLCGHHLSSALINGHIFSDLGVLCGSNSSLLVIMTSVIVLRLV
jgi:hypothetical protein